MNKKQIIEMIRKSGIQTIQLQFVNIHGQLHAIEKPISQIDSIIGNTIMIDGSSISGYTNISNSDLFLSPDWNTFMEVKFLNSNGMGKIGRVLCFINDKDGKPFSGDPRQILSKIVNKYKKQNYLMYAAFELEFFLLKKDSDNKWIPADNTGYFGVAPLDTADHIKREIAIVLQEHGYIVEAFHKEVAPGQHEINYKYSSALSAADQVLTAKWIIRTIAHKYNYVATFMPKPFEGINGSGMHTNISIFKDGKNLFYRNNLKSITKIQKEFITGLLTHTKEIASITNPVVNSYKRLIPGYEAPNCIAWSDSNRSTIIRVPGAIKNSTRIEIRNVDPCANPYLVLSLFFESGMDYINKNKKTMPPVYGNLYTKTRKELKDLNIELLPDSIGNALIFTSNSKFVEKVLGPHTFSWFLKLKFDEWDEYRKIVHNWEQGKYIEY